MADLGIWYAHLFIYFDYLITSIGKTAMEHTSANKKRTSKPH